MADISNIHYMVNLETVEAERTLERIDEDIGAHVAEMLRQIDGRPAGVIGYGGRVTRPKLFNVAA